MESGKHKCGWVAIMGPPNAGKSTLLNSYLGQKVAIVTPKPQTTRNQINGILTHPDAQIVFLDTPGVADLRGKMQRVLLHTAWQALAGGDVVLVVLDADMYVRKPQFLDNDLELLKEPVTNAARPILVALNKIDLFKDKSQLLPLIERVQAVWPEAEMFPVSALKEAGLDALVKRIKQMLPEGPPMYPADQVATVPVRFMASEIIREKLMLSLRQELPYNVAVDIEQWEEDPERNLAHIGAIIYVARPNHKAMVIGKAGQGLKAVGTAARKDIQELLDMKVFLELWVKVKEQWTEDPTFLHGLGLTSE
ncbi:MAG: GTPase Era [Desulfovibrionaceae bacterium]